MAQSGSRHGFQGRVPGSPGTTSGGVDLSKRCSAECGRCREPGRRGFFMPPIEKNGNNERIYVVSDAVKSVDTWR
jgi:hypothetical protein